MSGEIADLEWAALADLSPEERETRMADYCRTVVALDESARIEALAAMVRAEYALDEAALPDFTRSRLRAWIAIDQVDHELATRLARGYDTVFLTLPAATAMRRASVVQGVARHHLTAEELERLFALIPSIVQQVPRLKQDVLTTTDRRAQHAARPWWRFW